MDVRVVCATHQDLKQQIAESRFREDLFYRLAEIVVDIPPLRKRTGDAMLLAHAFLRRFAQEQKRPTMSFSEDAQRAIEAHPWPGNVRELQSAIRRAVIMADANRLNRQDLGLPPAPADQADEADGHASGASDLDLRVVREVAERQAVLSALARTDRNIVKAAELLGVSRPTLYDLMHRLAIR